MFITIILFKIIYQLQWKKFPFLQHNYNWNKVKCNFIFLGQYYSEWVWMLWWESKKFFFPLKMRQSLLMGKYRVKIFFDGTWPVEGVRAPGPCWLMGKTFPGRCTLVSHLTWEPCSCLWRLCGHAGCCPPLCGMLPASQWDPSVLQPYTQLCSCCSAWSGVSQERCVLRRINAKVVPKHLAVTDQPWDSWSPPESSRGCSL